MNIRMFGMLLGFVVFGTCSMNAMVVEEGLPQNGVEIGKLYLAMLKEQKPDLVKSLEVVYSPCDLHKVVGVCTEIVELKKNLDANDIDMNHVKVQSFIETYAGRNQLALCALMKQAGIAEGLMNQPRVEEPSAPTYIPQRQEVEIPQGVEERMPEAPVIQPLDPRVVEQYLKNIGNRPASSSFKFDTFEISAPFGQLPGSPNNGGLNDILHAIRPDDVIKKEMEQKEGEYLDGLVKKQEELEFQALQKQSEQQKNVVKAAKQPSFLRSFWNVVTSPKAALQGLVAHS